MGKIHSWLLIYDDLSESLGDGTAECGVFCSLDLRGISGFFTSCSAVFLVAGMGARGSGAIRLGPSYLSAVLISGLLCSAWWCLIGAYRAPCPPPPPPSVGLSTGLAQGPGFSGRTGKDWKGLDFAELLKGPRRFLLKKGHQIEMICVHDIFQYFFQRHKCHRALGFIFRSYDVYMTYLLSVFGDTNALKPILHIQSIPK